MAQFLIPLTHRGDSAASKDNVLWNEGSVYVMDNHRLALWCWFNELKKKNKKDQRCNIFHIDAHPDMSESALKDFNHDLWTMDLKDYREAWQADINMPLFRWDNYLEIFLRKYPELVGETVSATHHLGSSKKLSLDVKPYDLVKFSAGLFSGSSYRNDLPWIVNLDLDYFFSAAPEKLELFSEAFVETLSASFQEGLKNGMIQAFTISLSPECSGSWEKAEKMLKKFYPCSF